MPHVPFEERQRLIESPSESLGVELKSWLRLPAASTTLLRALFAMRNFNGGTILIGFDDAGRPLPPPNDMDIRAEYHSDSVQSLVSRYASEGFDIEVDFHQRAGIEHPVISIPAGVRTPVAVKRELKDTPPNTKHVEKDAVFVRSLSSSGIVSSTRIGWQDWPKLIETCLDNREADFGRFLRRNIAAADLQQMRDQLLSLVSDTKPASREDDVLQFLTDSHEHFKNAVATAGSPFGDFGTLEVAAVLQPPLPETLPSSELLNRLLVSPTRRSAWPFWVDSRSFGNEHLRPRVRDTGWQALLLIPEDILGPSADFWRIEPTGCFYHLRGLLEDIPPEDRPRRLAGQLDFVWAIEFATDALATALDLARALIESVPATTTDTSSGLSFAFRWSGLTNRRLTSGGHFDRNYYSSGTAVDPEVTALSFVPLDVADAAVPGIVVPIVQRLFVAFGGPDILPHTIEGIARRMLAQRI